MTVRLVLASASPRRGDILRQLGLEAAVSPADMDESYQDGETPEEHVERLARAKAEIVARRAPAALVVGGDTVVLDGRHVLGKPRDEEHAVRMLSALAGGQHEVLTGLALSGAHGTVSSVTRTKVRLRDFDERTARRYVSTGEPLDKAGGYGIQGLGASLVAEVEGDYFSVVGFPVSAFIDLLERAGWRYDFGSLHPTG